MEENINASTVGAVAALAVVGIIIWVWLKKRRSSLFLTITQESLSMKEVIAFFRQDEITKKLETDKNLLAVVIREKNNHTIKLILTLYQKEQEKVIDHPLTRCYLVKSIDADLEQSFGDKDMIVFS